MRAIASVFLLIFAPSYLHQSGAFTTIQGISSSRLFKSRLQSSVIEELTIEESAVEDDDIVEKMQTRRTVPVVNTAGMNISASNFFGKQVLSTAECKRELIGLLRDEIEIEAEFLAYRLEYLTKYLEYKYIPIQTTPFLNFALSGEWAMLYSNILTPRADETLEFKICQEIKPNEDDGSHRGTLNNIIKWKLNRVDDQSSGDLVVNCQYLFNTKGDLDVALVEHILMPTNESPKDVEDLIMSIQRSVPFESFDPNDIRIQNTVSTSSKHQPYSVVV